MKPSNIKYEISDEAYTIDHNICSMSIILADPFKKRVLIHISNMCAALHSDSQPIKRIQ